MREPAASSSIPLSVSTLSFHIFTRSVSLLSSALLLFLLVLPTVTHTLNQTQTHPEVGGAGYTLHFSALQHSEYERENYKLLHEHDLKLDTSIEESLMVWYRPECTPSPFLSVQDMTIELWYRLVPVSKQGNAAKGCCWAVSAVALPHSLQFFRADRI